MGTALKRLGIAVKNLGVSELNWRLARQANELRGWDVTFFCEDNVPPAFGVRGSVMRLHEGWGFTGPVIATNLLVAERVANFPGPPGKLLYAWDLEWLRLNPRPFRTLRAVYTHPRLRVAARTEEHARLLDDLWGVAVAGVVPKADLPSLLCLAGHEA